MIRTLQSQDEIADARARLRQRGLDFTAPGARRLWDIMFSIRYRTDAPPTDLGKGWDVANALEVAERFLREPNLPVLDLGCFNSEILWVLNQRGFAPLYGCDLSALCRWMPYWHRIRYDVADLTHTSYPDHSFALITCISVIEHGVPADALVSEVARLLRPGGIFVFTTDYDATGQSHAVAPEFRPFGLDWKIFSRPELWELIDTFHRAGLALLEPDNVIDRHEATPVAWEGESFTSVMVALRASA
jgi:SAM-dependent methyltransferase